MSRIRLLLKTLLHFRLAALAVVAGVAVATAVLTGALMVGDSVRASLRELAVQRLGPTDYALVSSQPFGEDLAQRIAASPGFGKDFSACVAGLSLRGGAADESGAHRTAGVQIAALNDWISPASGKCILNGQLADALGASEATSTVILNLPALDEVPRDATFAKRGRSDVASGLRESVQSVARGRDLASMFTLAPSQRLPDNAWVNLADLQNAVGQAKRANLLLVRSKDNKSSDAGAVALNAAVREVFELSDCGIDVKDANRVSAIGGEGAGGAQDAILSSRSTYVPGPVDHAAGEVAKATGIPIRRVLVYLVNNVVNVSSGAAQPQTIHYAIAAGLDPADGGPLADDEIVLNAWTAQQLKAKIGDRIRLDYYQRQANGDLREVRSDDPRVGLTFRVARILPMQGLAADSSLTPTYKGLTDATSVADWQPPEGLAINKKLITPEDEAYWKQYRAAPKLFVNLATARRLWGTAFGETNSIRVPADRAAQFAAALRRQIDPAQLGLVFQPVKARQLAAASGGTEFSGLFLGFSFFLIAAAAILVAMLFRLGIEQRARQFGLLAAVGFTPKAMRRLAIAEGLILASVGALVGIPLAIGYTGLMIAGLRTWWVGAVGTTALQLHVQYDTLAMGWGISVVVAMLAVIWAIWRIGRVAPATLLAGGWGRNLPSAVSRRRPVGLWLAIVGYVLGLGFLALAIAGKMDMQGAFMGGGALLLVSSLLLLGSRLRSRPRDPDLRHWSISRLGFRNAGRYPARSILTVALVAFATFVLVTVASMKQKPPVNTHDRSSGTGGYQLILSADVPLSGDLNTRAGRDLLGIRQPDDPIWSRARFVPLRLWAGQDISCLNLTRPDSPTILGVPPAMAEQGAFSFARSIRPEANPWQLLQPSANPADPIPAIADEETASYILKLGLGDTMPITDQLGRPRQLKLVATLAHSIFQSQLLISEADFLRLFPSQGGFGMVLVEAPEEIVPELRRRLSAELDDFSVSVEPTSDRLARYQDVANTYLSTFQTLGSLGLLLGTIGLAVVLLRSLVERRSELALLTAIGFTSGSRLRLVLAENALLLVLGLVIGAGCALLGILPAILASARAVNLPQLLLALAAILVAGLAAMLVSLSLASRHITPAALRAE